MNQNLKTKIDNQSIDALMDDFFHNDIIASKKIKPEADSGVDET